MHHQPAPLSRTIHRGTAAPQHHSTAAPALFRAAPPSPHSTAAPQLNGPTRKHPHASLLSAGAVPGCFIDPCGIALAHGHLYVAEYEGRRLQVITPLTMSVTMSVTTPLRPSRRPLRLAVSPRLATSRDPPSPPQVLTPLGTPLQIVNLPGGKMLAGICAGYSKMFVCDPRGDVLHVLEVRTQDTGQPSARAIIPRPRSCPSSLNLTAE